MNMQWGRLSPDSKAAAINLGYTKEKWDSKYHHLRGTPSPTASLSRSLGSRSKEQWTELPCVGPSPYPKSISPISISPTPDTAMRPSARRVGSGSRSQWTTPEETDTFSWPETKSAKELDMVMGAVPAVSASSSSLDGDDMSTDHSEATAVTGNVSTTSSKEKKSAKGKNRSRTRGPRRKLVMCGALDVTGELKESMQDVNETMRQIFTSVRRFGPDEKDAVRETFRDIGLAFIPRMTCRGSPDGDRMDTSPPPTRRNHDRRQRREKVTEKETVDNKRVRSDDTSPSHSANRRLV
mmetsp:Transcript_20182/g.42405  ORF Transcript_20182/g.42405 Transcript_20182/m.42405 type:complete len:295 (+) Transcript_20182:182-1066(+)|eukprot:CAMPEP_0183736930 /NCGR_PEP_ID=MMETSP0737-20130205/50630_1 /TAXON_ID=385413 /ORGANISM="Thalassiosira miniscula, Strain CCMP1093" /LENGTH=294 /DNA_ID=CAMNT_0025971077 /DNA_START=127 /DNA_END=1011 /DNA_ORIENTATION=+